MRAVTDRFDIHAARVLSKQEQPVWGFMQWMNSTARKMWCDVRAQKFL